MTAPNLLALTSATGKTLVANLVTSAISNTILLATGSNQVFKINTIILSNITGSVGYDATLYHYDGSTARPFAYQWSYSSGFGTQYAAPATSDGSTQSTEFNSNGTDFFAGSTRTSNYLSAYSYSIGIGWGTRYTNPGTSYPTSTVYDTVYNSVYNSLAWVSNAGAYGGYNWINSVNWGSALSTTTALPVVANLSLAFNNNGNIAFLGSGGTMGIYAFPYSTAGFGAKYSDPTYLPPTSAILNQLVSITS